MDIRVITDRYHVSPQIDPSDFDTLVNEGFVAVICNRPDVEIPPSHHAKAMETAAKEAGLAFHTLELTHQTMTPENIARQKAIIDGAGGKILAYCASGTRSTIAWALGQASDVDPSVILDAARGAGYQLDNIKPTLEAIASAKS